MQDPPPTILVVEDDHDERVMLRALLEQEGFVVVTAGNGQAALALLQSESFLPALALVDLRMPVMDGWDFIAAVRALPNRASLPIAVHSSSEEPAPSTACFVLRKPAAPRLLVSKIREHLRPTARSASSES